MSGALKVRCEDWGLESLLCQRMMLCIEPERLKLNQALPEKPRKGGNQNSISVTSHGSKRPIRRCYEAEKCKVTVHFTSDSVSVSLAGSPVNSQRAVKVARDRQQPPPYIPPHHLLLIFILSSAPSSTLLCFVFQLTGQGERRRCGGLQAFCRSNTPLLSFPSFQLMNSSSKSIFHTAFFNNSL